MTAENPSGRDGGVKMVAIKDYNGRGFEIPAGSGAVSRGGIIYFDGKPVCGEESRNGITHFARDDDGHGLERGRITGEITANLFFCLPYVRARYGRFLRKNYNSFRPSFYRQDIEVLRRMERELKGDLLYGDRDRFGEGQHDADDCGTP